MIYMTINNKMNEKQLNSLQIYKKSPKFTVSLSTKYLSILFLVIHMDFIFIEKPQFCQNVMFLQENNDGNMKCRMIYKIIDN